ncbi:MAG: hypothetical protein QM504_06830 [Pseudomonadota bacterium]
MVAIKLKCSEGVESLTKYSTEMLQSVSDTFDCIDEVVVFKTIHGLVARLERKEGLYYIGDSAKPLPMDLDALNLLAGLAGLRHVEVGNKFINLGFFNIENSDYHSVNGYWKDGDRFYGYIICKHDETPSSVNDDKIFFNGLDEVAIIRMIEEGRDTKEDFVIVSYSPIWN